MAAPYLVQLITRLAAGMERLDPQRQARHRQFVLAHRQPDGGYCGRLGGSDLYYTSFAVRLLMLLEGMDAEGCQGLAAYLGQARSRLAGLVDLVSWLQSVLLLEASGGPAVMSDSLPDWPDRLADVIEGFRKPDGGYAKDSAQAQSSTYHSFLASIAYEMIGRSPPDSDRLIAFLLGRQVADGGFIEVAPMKRGGTNPTAAAATALSILGGLDSKVRASVGEFLASVRSEEGGFRANTRVPFADGLSTFTALLTALDFDCTHLIQPDRLRVFAESIECPTGGFRGGQWDDGADVEYTFYGLGVLGLAAIAD